MCVWSTVTHTAYGHPKHVRSSTIHIGEAYIGHPIRVQGNIEHSQHLILNITIKPLKW